MRNHILISAVALSALALGIGLWAWQQRQPPAQLYASATVLQAPRPLPDFALTDQSGAPFNSGRLRGSWHLLFFGFTHCPDVCPNTLGLLHAVSEQMKLDAGGPALQTVFISVDPARDKPQQLSAYVRYFDPGFLAATGPVDELKKLTDALYLPFSYTAIDSKGDYSVDHSGSLVLLNPQGQAVAYFTPPFKLDAVVGDLRQLTRS